MKGSLAHRLLLLPATIWLLVMLVLPLLVPVFGLFYLFFAVGTRCRVCGQRLFLLQRCHKHKKAHHRRGLGYVLPMSIHMLLFKWFRCTHCGTAVRLKK